MSNDNVATLIERMTDYLNKGRPEVKHIQVRCRRSSVMRHGIKPAWRGGPLIVGGREIVTPDPVPRPVKPEAKKRRKSS